MISLISSLSLKLYLDSLVYHRNIFGSPSKVFGNLRKFSENVRERSPGLRKYFRKSLTFITDFYIIKRTLHVSSKIWILYCSCHSNINFISSLHRVISSIRVFFMLKAMKVKLSGIKTPLNTSRLRFVMVVHYSHKKITWNITKHQEILADFNGNPKK